MATSTAEAPSPARVDRLVEHDIPRRFLPRETARDLARIEAAEIARDWPEPDDDDRALDRYEHGMGLRGL